MKCKDCGGPVIQLFTGVACKAECDIKKPDPEPEYEYTSGGTRISPPTHEYHTYTLPSGDILDATNALFIVSNVVGKRGFHHLLQGDKLSSFDYLEGNTGTYLVEVDQTGSNTGHHLYWSEIADGWCWDGNPNMPA